MPYLLGLRDFGQLIRRVWQFADGTYAPAVILETTGTPPEVDFDAQHAEEALHADGDIGVFALGIRNDADAILCTTDLAYSGLSMDDRGKAKVAAYSAGTTIAVTPTVTAGAYIAGDCVGGVMEFVGAARITGTGGVIKNLLIADDAGQDAEMELWLFDQTIAADGDNNPWSPSESDLRNLVAIVTTADGAWFAAGTPSSARVEASQRYDCAATSLFGQLVTRGTPTFAATDDVTAILGLLQD